jgi:ubiquinone/menaquinone biosynthesis C-methylase UbiE
MSPGSRKRDRYREQWEKLGSHDPYWAVLSDPEKKGGKWDKGEFFESGRTEVEQVMNDLARICPGLRRGIALDFGCGVGRLSRALSQHFEQVIGVDVAESMLTEARMRNQGFPNIEFIKNTSAGLGFIAKGTVDLVYSNIVLQHMPGDRQAVYIGEFGRVLKTNGAAVFQTPSHHDLATTTGLVHRILGNRVLNVARRAIHGRYGIMEIHTLRRDVVDTTCERAGMKVVAAERYDATGRGFVSYRYYAVKG